MTRSLTVICCLVFIALAQGCSKPTPNQPLRSVGMFKVDGTMPFTETGFNLVPGQYYEFRHRAGTVCIQPERRCAPPRGNDLSGEEAWGLYLKVGDDLVHVRDGIILTVQKETPLTFYVPDGEELAWSEEHLPLYADNSGFWDIEVLTFEEAPEPEFIRGISVTSYSPDGYCSTDMVKLLNRIRALGANSVQFVAVMQTDGDRIFPADHSPRTFCLIKATDTALAVGLKVTWNLHVDPPGDQWRGALKPKDKDKFFAEYRQTALFYAKLAQDHGVHSFVPATEMVSLMENKADRDRWLSIFLELHSVFFGSIFYAADRTEYHYLGSDFWHTCCDEVGITPWYTLTTEMHPTYDELARTWEPIVKQLEQFSEKVKMRIVLTEGPGYRAIEGCNIAPAEYWTKRDGNVLCQTETYKAFLQAFPPARRNVIAGHFVWEVTAPGEETSEYSPLERITEGVLLQEWKKK